MRWMLLSLIASSALAQAPLPELKFQDPPNFYRSGSYPPADFSSNEVNASLQVYPFQRFTGDVQHAFTSTLMRDLIDPRYRETNVAPGAKLDATAVQGARMVYRARFIEVVAGQPHERMRMVIVAAGAIAIVDAQAVSMMSWQRVLQPLNAFASTLHVVAGEPEPEFTTQQGAAGRVIAGLYMGFARKYMTDLQRGPAYGYYTNALQYYLFSADGRVYRHYDELKVPGNDPARFDYSGAQREDPVNSGHYAIRGDSIYVRMGTQQQPESFVFRMPSGGSIQIGSVSYKRQ